MTVAPDAWGQTVAATGWRRGTTLDLFVGAASSSSDADAAVGAAPLERAEAEDAVRHVEDFQRLVNNITVGEVASAEGFERPDGRG